MDLVMLSLITGLFFALLIAKRWVKKEFCVMCVSISSTWLLFLVPHLLGYRSDPMLLGILMGESIVGMFYLMEKKTKERWHIFRLPFLLTLTLVAYALIAKSWTPGASILVIALWFIFGLIYMLRTYESLSRIAKHIIACCKRW